jgi:hypothetical protein
MKTLVLAILIGLCAAAAYASFFSDEKTVARPLPHVVVTLNEDGGVVIETNVPVEIRFESPPESSISFVTRRTAAALRTARTLASALLQTAKSAVYPARLPGAGH